ncbi:hypothetical protein QCM79_27505 [Bradyrhizobium sp. SSUT77]|nr:hypothetical protein [Bradyrhizobium sp. SSUT77]
MKGFAEGLTPAIREAVRCGQHHLRRTSRPNGLGGNDRGVPEFVERGALRLGRLHGVCDQIDRKAGNRTAVIAAHLLDPPAIAISAPRPAFGADSP